MKIVPNVGHSLLPKTDLVRLSIKTKTLGTQIPIASMTMIRSCSNCDWNQSSQNC